MVFRKKISRYRGVHTNETAFILGTGPSIKKEDLSKLQGKIVYTINGATILQEQFGFKPTFFCTSDSRFLNSSKRELATSSLHQDTVRLVRDVIRPYDDTSLEKRTHYISTLGKNGFSKHMDRGFYFWCTSISLAIQMAWYTSAKRVALLGVDLSYATDQPRFYKEDIPQPVDPFVGVQIQNIAMAAQEFEAAGREFVCCSETSMLRPYLSYKRFDSLV